ATGWRRTAATNCPARALTHSTVSQDHRFYLRPGADRLSPKGMKPAGSQRDSRQTHQHPAADDTATPLAHSRRDKRHGRILMPAIEINGLSKRFGGVAAVDDLSFSTREGAVTGFLGPNGAGKTTTLRMLLGLVTATEGTTTVDGRPYADLAEPARQVGAVLESTGFHPGRRARQHLRMLATAAGLPLARIDEVLAEVDLTDVADRRVKGFSLGMRQRLGLASALLGAPNHLILDEPTNGLDPEGV